MFSVMWESKSSPWSRLEQWRKKLLSPPFFIHALSGLKLWGWGLVGFSCTVKLETKQEENTSNLLFFVWQSEINHAICTSWCNGSLAVYKCIHMLSETYESNCIRWLHCSRGQPGLTPFSTFERCKRRKMAWLRPDRPSFCEEKGIKLFIRCVPCGSST